MQHSIDHILSYDLDFKERNLSGENISVMIATTPRSGSTFFCHELWKNGSFGAPTEYTNPHMCKNILSMSNSIDFITYWQDIKTRRTSPNGVFSYKMFPYYFQDIINKFGDAVEAIEFDKVIYFYRRDPIAQAISYTRASQTKRWFAEFPEKITPVYNFEQIIKSLTFFAGETDAWEKIFRKYEVKPLIICYEDFLSNKNHEIQRIIDFLGVIECDTLQYKIPEIKKQGDSINTIWRKRFLLDLEKKNDVYYNALSRINTGRVFK